MKNKRLMLGLFVVVALLQAAAPLYMAWRWEDILQTGHRFHWQTAPVDPADAFRGRYIDLRFKEDTAPVTGDLITGQQVYALIAENAEGQAYISAVSVNRPAQGYYVKVRAYAKGPGTAHVTLPFTRYYLPENLAPAAENAYGESAGKTGVAAVRIKDGYGVVEQLYIGEQTLYEFLRQPQ